MVRIRIGFRLLLMQGRMKLMGMMSLVGDSRTFPELAEGLIRANNSTYNMMMIIKSEKNHDMTPTMCVVSFLKEGAGTEGKISRTKCCFRHDFEVLKMGANIGENGG